MFVNPLYPWMVFEQDGPPLTTFTRPLRETLLRLFLEVKGDLVAPLYETQVNFSHSLSVTPVFFFPRLSCSHPCRRLFRATSACAVRPSVKRICAYWGKHASAFATEQTLGGKSNAVAMVS